MPGYLKTLTHEQHLKLLQFWAMTILYNEMPLRGGDPSFADLQALGASLLEQVQKEHFDGLQNYGGCHLFGNSFEKPYLVEIVSQAGIEDLDALMLRFLRARKWNLVPAFVLLAKFIQWRRTEGIRGFLLRGELAIKSNFLESGLGFVWGVDKKDRVIIFIRAHIHDKNKTKIEDANRFVIHVIESARRLRTWDEQCLDYVFDLGQVGLASLDLSLVKFIISCFEAYYPETLGNLILLDAPWIFKGFWKIISPLLDPVTAAKVAFVNRKSIQEYIDSDMLPTEFGGTCNYEYIYQMHPELAPLKSTLGPSSEASSSFSNNSNDAKATLDHLAARLDNQELKMLDNSLSFEAAKFFETSLECLSAITHGDTVKFVECSTWRSNQKRILKEMVHKMELLSMPPDHYQCIGVKKPTGHVSWICPQE